MIEKHIAAQKIERFTGLDWFPANPSARQELILAMQRADSEVIAEVVTSEWLAAQREAPKPADLRAMIHSENERVKAASPRAECKLCGGTGYLIVERAGLSGAKDCQCRQKL